MAKRGTLSISGLEPKCDGKTTSDHGKIKRDQGKTKHDQEGKGKHKDDQEGTKRDPGNTKLKES